MLQEWLSEKFVEPLCKYYTIEATITYALVLAAVVYGVYMLLKKLKVKIDRRLLIGVLPFILFGGWTRALRDHGLYQGWWWCSPPIYVLVFAITLGSLLAGLLLQKRCGLEYHKAMLAIGGALLLYDLALTNITNLEGFGTILGLSAAWAAAIFGFHRLRPKLLSLENAGIISAHMLDASSTFTALSFFGYYEQHVLPTFLISMAGPWVMFPLKLVVITSVLLIIDKYGEDRFFCNFLKLAILILGLAPGFRDLMTVSMI
ncbi:MAG: DUF63 family protein [Candidatus Aenigmatarchaeota archaeon]